MDRLIKRFDVIKDNDLMICELRGVAYQRDMNVGRVEYGAEYLARYDSFDYTFSDTAHAVMSGRLALLARHTLPHSSVLDVGTASGAFVRAAAGAGFAAKGFDVIEQSAERLKADGLYADDPRDFDAVTLWDCIEHMEAPEVFFRHIRRGALVFASIPVFDDMRQIRRSKHYKPGEHLYYWTAQGFINWMAMYGFRLLEQSAHETDAGRDSVGAFAFCKDLPDYDDYIEAYKQMHCSRHYGSSATELHLATIAKIVAEIKPYSILDFGCGRSDLIAHFWLDGKRIIKRYDPAIPMFHRMPGEQFDLVLCCDVMEHIPIAAVDRIFSQVRDRGKRAVFTISTKPARAKLPDGRNAHVTLLSKSEWFNWIKDKFGKAIMLPSALDFELIILAEKI